MEDEKISPSDSEQVSEPSEIQEAAPSVEASENVESSATSSPEVEDPKPPSDTPISESVSDAEASEPANDPIASAIEEAEGEEASLPDDHSWYVVRTYSGYEQKAKLALMERIKQNGMEKDFSKILIPSENVIELVRGQKKTTSRKFFPGYMLVRMNLTDPTWHVLKNTPKVTGFVGNALKPPAVPEEEVAKITTQMQEGSLKPRPRVSFTEGENVRVIDGPFNNFNGLVEHVDEGKGKLRVLVSIFGRSTPVELDFVQVEKN